MKQQESTASPKQRYMYPICEIPSVDLGPFFQEKGVVVGEDATEDQREVASVINRICKDHGFVHVTNFGMSKQFGQRLFAASEELFDPARTGGYEVWSPATNTGFSSYRNESLNSNRPPDLKEAFNVRFPPRWENPSLPKTPQSFQSLIDEYTQIMKTASMRYGLVCSLALDLPLDTFTSQLKTYDLCTARFLHYPPCDFQETSASASINEAIRVGEHTDFGAYTFLLLRDNQGPMGLQIRAGKRGGACGGAAGGEECGWKDVRIRHGEEDKRIESFGAIINTGSMMARMTNDFWKATPHRVIVPTAESAIVHRYSIAFFVDPDADEIIEVQTKYKDATEGTKEYHEPITSTDFILMKLKEMSEVNVRKV